MPGLIERLSQPRACYYCNGLIAAGTWAYVDRKTGNFWHTDKDDCVYTPPKAVSTSSEGPKAVPSTPVAPPAAPVERLFVQVAAWVPIENIHIVAHAIREAREEKVP
jgi:hypothetical protein